MIRNDDFFYHLKPNEENKEIIPFDIRPGMLIRIDFHYHSLDLYQINLKGNIINEHRFLSSLETNDQVFLVVRVGWGRSFLDFLWNERVWRMFAKKHVTITHIREEELDEESGNPYGFSDEEMRAWIKNGRLGNTE